MTHAEVNNAYFDWMYDLVCGNRYPSSISFRRLLLRLHNTEFIFSIPKDANRAEDGISLRYRFAYQFSSPAAAETCLGGPCSVLEMMIALAIRCEEDFMDDPLIGDRVGQWFWGMIVNLGLGSMDDARFDSRYVEDVIARFLERDYEPNGRGGLFTIKNCNADLRDVEIWYQLCWYLDSIT